eukprot:CAMPEP_0171089410 /NCGR_PEP_ID=MMETSP0766_2-20121228/25078_1 /TAXON_ID=439317 /ORGANISM="Gambierdiscus australes, Strain CAWD 149" /LENGTH=113 /DNA_ID=CAMNT_0011547281 /DNA_START=93 /DNA_END=434 /DNA_ORIENTATION=+
MKACAARVVAVLMLAASVTQASARIGTGRELQPEIATKVAGLEGEACSDDEYKRYQTIVCKLEATCGCAETVCELDWCSKYVHEWKTDFGACILKGCEPPSSGESAPEEQPQL